MFTIQEVINKIDNIARDFNSLIISAYQNNDD